MRDTAPCFAALPVSGAAITTDPPGLRNFARWVSSSTNGPWATSPACPPRLAKYSRHFGSTEAGSARYCSYIASTYGALPAASGVEVRNAWNGLIAPAARSSRVSGCRRPDGDGKDREVYRKRHL